MLKGDHDKMSQVSKFTETLEHDLQNIKINCRKPVNELLASEYHSSFKGRGLDFDELREYQPGDDVRLIDWNVTARLGHPHIKRFIEERELSLYLLVDFSASMDFGSQKRNKRLAIAELCALLSLAAKKNNDKVALIIFTDEVELYLPPGKGHNHITRLIAELLSFQPKSKKTDLNVALDFIGQITRKSSTVFLMSDFLSDQYQDDLMMVAQRHDFIAVSVSDPFEHEFQSCGLVQLQDSENGEVIMVDSSSRKFQANYKSLATSQQMNQSNWFLESGIDHINLKIEEPIALQLVSFFKRRERQHGSR